MSAAVTGYAVCTAGIESLLKRELEALGATDCTEGRGGVAFRGSLETRYRACLWSRTASRILHTLVDFPCRHADDLYAAAHAVNWPALFAVDAAFRVDVSGQSPALAHTGFAALKVKDAIADRFRAVTGERPSVAREQPDVVVHLHLDARGCTLSLDLCGTPLHERGWRQMQADAPLKETLAAALLLRCGWPDVAAQGGALVDPCCGGGTLLIEGLLIAADVAPGLQRTDWTLQALSDHDPSLWQGLRDEARQRASRGLESCAVQAWGFDHDPRVLDAARRNAVAAGVDGLLRTARRDLTELQAPAGATPGLLIGNPPYGERLGEQRTLQPLYRALGQRLREQYANWRCAIYTSGEPLVEALNLPVRKRHQLMNGPLKCTLLQLDARPRSGAGGGPKLSEAATMLINRLEKNQLRLRGWLKERGISCWRAYDADLPEYAAAIDVYTGEDAAVRLHIQEYQAPKSIPLADQERRLRELVQAAAKAFDCPSERVYLKQRARQRGSSQYQRRERSGDSFVVREGDARFEVNLADFLDSGLFLDSRTLRQRLHQRARGKRLLNLFCYTGSASVQAALGGAESSTSVDLSPTYTQWAGRNFALNRLDPDRHRIITTDAVRWLCQQPPALYDLIYLDPPTFSNSKRTETVLDVVEDHLELIDLCMERLAPAGELLFVTNAQGFKLHAAAAGRWQVHDWTQRSIPPDFVRPRAIHQSFLLHHQRQPLADSSHQRDGAE